MEANESTDVFEDVLNLEEQYYREGYALGVADGSKSGRIEGRVFGLQKGFEKFVEMGRLNGRATVWEARLPKEAPNEPNAAPDTLLPLTHNARLKKHIQRLAALTDPDDLSADNSEDAVSEFEDRLKDAKAKARIVTRMVDEDRDIATDSMEGNPDKEAPRTNDGSGTNAATKRMTGEMEDFVGLPETIK